MMLHAGWLHREAALALAVALSRNSGWGWAARPSIVRQIVASSLLPQERVVRRTYCQFNRWQTGQRWHAPPRYWIFSMAVPQSGPGRPTAFLSMMRM